MFTETSCSLYTTFIENLDDIVLKAFLIIYWDINVTHINTPYSEITIYRQTY